jgi:nucleotide-binding universal stress UspA family protein
MPFLFKNILVAIDFHDSSLNAMEVAKTLAQKADGTVFLLHVVPMDERTGGSHVRSGLQKTG